MVKPVHDEYGKRLPCGCSQVVFLSYQVGNQIHLFNGEHLAAGHETKARQIKQSFSVLQATLKFVLLSGDGHEFLKLGE
jgi:hypothetical protein